MTHAIDRQAIVDSLWASRTELPRGLQLESFGQMFHRDWESPRFDLAEARRLLREAGYRGEPIPYRCLNNYYTNQTATAQVLVEMWRASGLNVQLHMLENWSQVTEAGATRGIRDWSVTHVYSDPLASLVRAMGPRGELQRAGEWIQAEFNALAGELEASTDRDRRRLVFRRMLEIAERHGAVDMDEREATWRREGWTGYTGGTAAGASTGASTSGMSASTRGTSAGEEAIPIVEENLRVGKRQVEGGHVRIRSYVVETPVQEQVNLRQERVQVERRPVDRAAQVNEDFRDRTIEASERSEEAVVSKEARVKEEVVVNKDVRERTETVEDTVRRTEVEVEDDRTGASRTGTTDRDRR